MDGTRGAKATSRKLRAGLRKMHNPIRKGFRILTKQWLAYDPVTDRTTYTCARCNHRTTQPGSHIDRRGTYTNKPLCYVCWWREATILERYSLKRERAYKDYLDLIDRLSKDMDREVNS